MSLAKLRDYKNIEHRGLFSLKSSDSSSPAPFPAGVALALDLAGVGYLAPTVKLV